MLTNNLPNLVGGSQSGRIMAGALMLGAVTSKVPPAAAVIIAGGAIAAVYAYKKIGGKDGFHTTYQPVSQNPIHRPAREPDKYPKGNDNLTKWFVRAAAAYEMYDNYKEKFNTFNFHTPAPARQDNTYVAPTIGPARS